MKLSYTRIGLLILFAGMLAFSTVASGSPNVRSILQKADILLNRPGGYEYLTRLEVFGNNRINSAYLMNTIRKGSDRMLIVFKEPLRIKDQAILKNKKDQWIYFPKIKRTLKISSDQQLVGSDFSYGDILSLNLEEEYHAETVDENRIERDTPCYYVKLTAKHETSLYNRVDYLIRKTDFAPLRRDYYTKSGQLLKTLVFSQHDTDLMPRVWEMTSRLTPGNRTMMFIDKITRNDNLSDALFSLSSLKNG